MRRLAQLVLAIVLGTGTVPGAADDAMPDAPTEAVPDAATEAVPGSTTEAMPGAAPDRLGETGLYVAGTTMVRPDVLPYSPQYSLWSDGAAKRRWLWLPPGTAIDAVNADAWEFPTGTKVWKEFRHERRVETRLIERLADGSWRYASYVWNADETDARLAPEAGISALDAAGAPKEKYVIPSHDDCRACHEAAAVPVLGIGALQLSPDRDPLAPHSEVSRAGDIDLNALAALGLVENLPPSLLATPPRIAAASPTERAALGYLHANCGHCHNDSGPLALLDLSLAQGTRGSAADRARQALIGRAGDFRLNGAELRVAAGDPAASVVARRMRSRNPVAQMPPLGTRVADDDALAVIEHWIRQLGFEGTGDANEQR